MSGLLSRLLSTSKPPADQAHHHKTTISNELLESAQADGAAVLQRLHTETNGLTAKEARARLPLILSSLIIVAFGAWLPTSSLLAGALGLVPLPLSYWPLLAAILLCYMVLTQFVKTWFIRRYAID